MRAFPIGYKDGYIRIFDMTPSATVKVFDYEEKKVYKALKSKKLELVDTYIKDGKIMYTYYEVDNLPNWENQRENCNVLFEIGMEFERDNKFTIHFVDLDGRVGSIDAVDAYHASIRETIKFTNIRFDSFDRLSSMIEIGDTGIFNINRRALQKEDELGIKFSDIEGYKVLNVSDQVKNGEREIIIPSDIDRVKGYDNTVNIVVEERHTLNRRLFGSLESSHFVQEEKIPLSVEFRGTIDTVGFRAISGKYCKFIMPDNIRNIMSNGIYGIKMSTLNMLDYEETIIRKGVLNFSRIDTLVLPRNTKEIEMDAMKYMEKLGTVYFPPSIKAMKSDIGSSINNKKVLAITVKGSYAEGILKLNPKFRVLSCNTEEAAIEKVMEYATGEDRAFISRAKMIYNNGDEASNVVQQIINEKPDSAKELVELYRKLTRKPNRDKNKRNIVLDVSKFKKPVKASDIPYGKNGLKVPDLVRIPNRLKGIDDLSDTFRILSNLITQSSVPMDRIMNIKNLGTVFNNYTISNSGEEVIYEEDCGSIIQLQYYINSNNQSITYEILMIIIGEYVVYATCQKDYSDSMEKFGNVVADMHNFDAQELGEIENRKSRDVEISLCDYINIDDNIVRTCSTINRIELTQRLSICLTNMFCEQMMIIGVVTSTLDHNTTRVISLVDGTVLNLESIKDTNKYFRYKSTTTTLLSAQYVTKKYKATTGLNKTDVNIVAKMFESAEIVDSAEKAIIGEEEILEMLSKLPGAYDPLEPCLEWEISKRFNENGIKKRDQLTYTDMIDIFNTAYFMQGRPSDAVEMRQGGRYSDKEFEIGDGSIVTQMGFFQKNVTMPVIGYNPGFAYFIKNPIYPEAKNLKFISSYDLNTILNKIMKIYDPSEPKYGYIHEYGKINISPDAICSIHATGFYGMSRMTIGINKSTGHVYLMYENDKCSVQIARLRDVQSGVEILMKGSIYKTKKDDKILDYDSLMNYNIDTEGKGLRILRGLVVDGYPNGFYPENVFRWEFRKVAKQSPEAKDIYEYEDGDK